jgi:hypothetical protein
VWDDEAGVWERTADISDAAEVPEVMEGEEPKPEEREGVGESAVDDSAVGEVDETALEVEDPAEEAQRADAVAEKLRELEEVREPEPRAPGPVDEAVREELLEAGLRPVGPEAAVVGEADRREPPDDDEAARPAPAGDQMRAADAVVEPQGDVGAASGEVPEREVGRETLAEAGLRPIGSETVTVEEADRESADDEVAAVSTVGERERAVEAVATPPEEVEPAAEVTLEPAVADDLDVAEPAEPLRPVPADDTPEVPAPALEPSGDVEGSIAAALEAAEVERPPLEAVVPHEPQSVARAPMDLPAEPEVIAAPEEPADAPEEEEHLRVLSRDLDDELTEAEERPADDTTDTDA